MKSRVELWLVWQGCWSTSICNLRLSSHHYRCLFVCASSRLQAERAAGCEAHQTDPRDRRQRSCLHRCHWRQPLPGRRAPGPSGVFATGAGICARDHEMHDADEVCLLRPGSRLRSCVASLPARKRGATTDGHLFTNSLHRFACASYDAMFLS